MNHVEFKLMLLLLKIVECEWVTEFAISTVRAYFKREILKIKLKYKNFIIIFDGSNKINV